jgi:hypothetical protein
VPTVPTDPHVRVTVVNVSYDYAPAAYQRIATSALVYGHSTHGLQRVATSNLVYSHATKGEMQVYGQFLTSAHSPIPLDGAARFHAHFLTAVTEPNKERFYGQFLTAATPPPIDRFYGHFTTAVREPPPWAQFYSNFVTATLHPSALFGSASLFPTVGPDPDYGHRPFTYLDPSSPWKGVLAHLRGWLNSADSRPPYRITWGHGFDALLSSVSSQEQVREDWSPGGIFSTLAAADLTETPTGTTTGPGVTGADSLDGTATVLDPFVYEFTGLDDGSYEITLAWVADRSLSREVVVVVEATGSSPETFSLSQASPAEDGNEASWSPSGFSMEVTDGTLTVTVYGEDSGIVRADLALARRLVNSVSPVPEAYYAFELGIVDADDRVVIDTRQAFRHRGTAWGSALYRHDWVGPGWTLQAVQRTTASPQEAYTWPPAADIVAEDAVLDAECILIAPRQVETLWRSQWPAPRIGRYWSEGKHAFATGATEVLPEAELAEGYNADFTMVRTTEPERVRLAIIPGEGTGKPPLEVQEEDGVELRVINGIRANALGDISLTGDNCITVKLEGDLYEPPIDMPLDPVYLGVFKVTPSTIEIGNDCRPCCDCNDYEDVLNNLLVVRGDLVSDTDNLTVISDQFIDLVEKFIESDECRKRKPFTLQVVSRDCKYVDVMLAICNANSRAGDNDDGSMNDVIATIKVVVEPDCVANQDCFAPNDDVTTWAPTADEDPPFGDDIPLAADPCSYSSIGEVKAAVMVRGSGRQTDDCGVTASTSILETFSSETVPVPQVLVQWRKIPAGSSAAVAFRVEIAAVTNPVPHLDAPYAGHVFKDTIVTIDASAVALAHTFEGPAIRSTAMLPCEDETVAPGSPGVVEVPASSLLFTVTGCNHLPLDGVLVEVTRDAFTVSDTTDVNGQVTLDMSGSVTGVHTYTLSKARWQDVSGSVLITLGTGNTKTHTLRIADLEEPYACWPCCDEADPFLITLDDPYVDGAVPLRNFSSISGFDPDVYTLVGSDGVSLVFEATRRATAVCFTTECGIAAISSNEYTDYEQGYTILTGSCQLQITGDTTDNFAEGETECDNTVPARFRQFNPALLVNPLCTDRDMQIRVFEQGPPSGDCLPVTYEVEDPITHELRTITVSGS